jgi:ligand-binding sensor domain-containing protein
MTHRSGFRKTATTMIQFLVGFFGVIGLGFLVLKLLPQQKMPPGWEKFNPPQDVMALSFYEGYLWSGGRDGVFVINPDTREFNQELLQGLEFSGVTDLLVTDWDNALWISHRNGVSRLKDGRWMTFTTADGLPQNQTLGLGVGEDEEVWVGSLHGVACYKDGQFNLFSQQDGLANNVVSLIFKDSQDRLWFGNSFTSRGGLTVWDGHTWDIIAPGELLPHPTVTSILEPNPGEFWIGTGFANMGGLAYFDGQHWRHMFEVDGLAGAKVRSLFIDNEGRLWVGSEYDGIAIFEHDQNHILTAKDGLAGWEVKAILQEEDGTLWLGTESGLTRIDKTAYDRIFHNNND